MNASHPELSPMERDHAVVALGVHFREGRLTPNEFASRCDRAHVVTTRHDLDALFSDLPEPHGDSVLSTAAPETDTEPSPEPHRYRNILDQPIAKTPLTHRRFRVIGWIMAVLWIPLFGELITLIMPDFLEVGALYTPLLLMATYTIAIRPLKPKYVYMDPNPSKHRIIS